MGGYNSKEINDSNKKAEGLKHSLKILYKSQKTIPKFLGIDKVREQSLEDYYINMKLRIVSQIQGRREIRADSYDKVREEQYIEIDEIFDALGKSINNQKLTGHEVIENKDSRSDEKVEQKKPVARSTNSDVNRILIVGSAGVGKTTLLQHVTYQWSNNKLWNDKFDFIFMVELQKLSSDRWKSGYANEVRKNPLECFLHYCLPKSESVELDDIINIISNKDKVLLLLDGYDEIAHLTADSSSTESKIISKVLSTYKNVIMTTRHYALPRDIANSFERQVENIGLDDEGIKQYIDNSLSNSKHEEKKSDESNITSPKDNLLNFLNNNPAIKQICRVPINITILNFIWQDSGVREKLSSMELLAGTLYEEMIVMLGKRYVEKFKGVKKEDLSNQSRSTIFVLKEVEFLKNVAYQEFTDKEGKLMIPPVVIERFLSEIQKQDKDFKLGDIHKFGLLKPEGERGEDAINKPHYFVHFTFQEYFTAYKLYEELKKSGHEGNKAAELISLHRNEPRYLMTLKFLAGIVSQSLKEADLDNNSMNANIISGAHKYWEAITCNVDGMLELGIERKVTLLMHLLSQTRNKGKLNEEAKKQIEAAKKLVDITVLEDIGNWIETIKLSGYLSKNIKKCLQQILEGELLWGEHKANELKKVSGMGASTSITESKETESEENKEIPGSQREKRNDFLIISTLKLVEEVWRKLDAKDTEQWEEKNDNIKQELYSAVEQLTRSKKTQIAITGISVLSNIISKELEVDDSAIANIKDKMKSVLGYLFEKIIINDFRHVAAEGIAKILGSLNDKVLINDIIDNKVKHLLSMNTLNANEIRIAQNVFTKLVLYGREEIAGLAIKMLDEALENRMSELRLDKISKDDKLDAIMYVLVHITAIKSRKPVVDMNNIVNKLQLLLKNGVSQLSAEIALTNILVNKEKNNISSVTIEEKLVPLLENIKAGKAIARILAKTIENDNHALLDVIIGNAIQKLADIFFDESGNTLNITMQNAREVLITVSSNEELGTKVKDKLVLRLKSKNDNKQSKAIDTLVRITEEGNKKIVANMGGAIKDLKLLMKNSINPDVAGGAARLLGNIVANEDENLATSDVIEELMLLLNHKNSHVRSDVINSLGQIIVNKKEKIAPVINELANKLGLLLNSRSTGELEKKSAVYALGNIAISGHVKITPIIYDFIKLLQDDKSIDVKKAVLTAIDKIAVRGEENLATNDMVQELVKFLQDKDIKKAAFTAIGNIAVNSEGKILIINKLLETAINLIGNNINAPSKTILVPELDAFIRKTGITKDVEDTVSKIFSIRSFDEIERYIKYEKLKNISTNALVIKLRKPDNLLKDLKDFNIIDKMLRLTGTHVFDDGRINELELQSLAKDILYKQLEHFDERMMAYINANFEYLLDLSNEAKAFLKEVCLKVMACMLSFDESTKQTGINFIIKCMDIGFTMSITKTGEIVFEGHSYRLSDKDNEQYIEQISWEALRHGIKSGDVLASQYTEYKPIFINEEYGTRKAATDIKEVRSLIGNKELPPDERITFTDEETARKKILKPLLGIDAWCVSLVRLAYGKGVSADKNLKMINVFLLIEGRDAFGNVVIRKISKTNEYNKTLHPYDVTGEEKQQVFGAMEYHTEKNIEGKPRYYATIFSGVSYDEVKKLSGILSQGWEHKEAKSDSREDTTSSLIAILETWVGKEKIESKGLNLELAKYIKHENTAVLKKYDVLDVDVEGVRKSSVIIDNTIKIEVVEQDVTEVKEEVGDIQTVTIEHENKITMMTDVMVTENKDAKTLISSNERQPLIIEKSPPKSPAASAAQSLEVLAAATPEDIKEVVETESRSVAEELEIFIRTAEELRAKIGAGVKGSDMMQQKITDIVIKTQNLSDIENIEQITAGITSLKSKKAVNIKHLEGIEEEASGLLRNEKLVILRNIAGELREKINTANKDKEAIQGKIADILYKAETLASIEEIERVTESIRSLKSKKIVNLKHLEGLETEMEDFTSTIMLHTITYNEELLNHPRLLASSIKLLGIRKTSELISQLDVGLKKEAMDIGDADIILAGLISLDYEAAF